MLFRSKADMHKEVATDAYQGGLLFHSHGGVHPARYQQSLMAAARHAGAQVFGYTPVTGWQRHGKGFTVHTPHGALEANDVLLATNGYTAKPFKDQASGLVPIPSFLIATEPLGVERVRALLRRSIAEETVLLHTADLQVDVRARAFLPGAAVPEDPATGSANACVAGYLAARTPRDGTLAWTVGPALSSVVVIH